MARPDPSEALASVREALAAERIRLRMQGEILDDIARQVMALERACVRHVAEARGSATIAERERCAGIIAREIGGIVSHTHGAALLDRIRSGK